MGKDQGLPFKFYELQHHSTNIHQILHEILDNKDHLLEEENSLSWIS